MKNNFKFFLIYLTLCFVLSVNANANEQFVFDVTEIEILENGNLIIGKKSGKVTVDDGSIITADNFKYNKILNILEAEGNVKFENEIKDLIILSDSAIYNKDIEELITRGNSKAIKTNNTITADNFKYNKILNILEAEGNVKFENEIKDLIILSDSAIYNKDIEELITRGNSKAIKTNNTITADNLIYKKKLNVLKASKNVKIIDSLKDVTILSEDITYDRNKETFFSKGLTESVIENRYNIKSKDVLFSKKFST